MSINKSLWATVLSAATIPGGSMPVLPSSGTSANSLLLNGYVQAAAAVANTIALRDALGGLTIAALLATAISCNTLASTVATGTAPLTVASTTQVANLNASYLQGYQPATAATANTLALRDGSGGIAASTVTTPLVSTVNSTVPLVLFDPSGSHYGGTLVMNATGSYYGVVGNCASGQQWALGYNGAAGSGTMTAILTWTTAGVSVSGNLTAANATTASASFNGYSVVASTANNSNGSITLGTTTAYRGILDYNSGGNTILSLSNTYNNASAVTQFPIGSVIALSMTQSMATFAGNVSAKGFVPTDATAAYGLQYEPTAYGVVLQGYSSTGATADLLLMGPSLQVMQVPKGTSTALFSGQVQIAANASVGQLYLASNGSAPSTVANCLYNVSSNPYWNGYEILTMGNLNSTAAALMATQAQVLAPQWVASLPSLPNSQYPAAFWDSVNSIYQGGYVCILSSKAMYQNQGGSWVSVGVSQGIFGKVVAGSISAASIGATALVTNLALVSQYISSQAFNSGATSAQISGGAGSGWGIPAYSGQQGLPVGWAIYSTGITTTCYNGDPTNASSVWTTPTVQAEFGAGISLGGYDLSGLSIGKLLNGGFKECIGAGTYVWICPPNITKLTITLCAGGAGGGASNSGGGGAGGTTMAVLTVVPLNKYTIVVGAGGATATNGSDSTITNTTTGVTLLTVKGGLASATAGVAGQGGASCSLFSDGGLPGSNGVRTPPTVASLAIFNTWTADGKTHHVLQVCPGAGGGANISGASQTGGAASSGYVVGGAPSSAGGGGSSAMGVGGYGAAASTNPGQAGQGYGSGGGGGISVGAYTGGAGAPGYALLQW